MRELMTILAQVHACQVMRAATANAFSFSSGDKRVDKTGQPGHWAKLEAGALRLATIRNALFLVREIQRGIRSKGTFQCPCRKTQVPAGAIESKARQVLADLPKRVQEIPLTDRMRRLSLRFSTAWSLLSSEGVGHVLPRVIQEIIYNPDR